VVLAKIVPCIFLGVLFHELRRPFAVNDLQVVRDELVELGFVVLSEVLHLGLNLISWNLVRPALVATEDCCLSKNLAYGPSLDITEPFCLIIKPVHDSSGTFAILQSIFRRLGHSSCHDEVFALEWAKIHLDSLQVGIDGAWSSERNRHVDDAARDLLVPHLDIWGLSNFS